MWLLHRGEAPRPVFNTPTRVTHEWWDGDGEHVLVHQGWRGHMACLISRHKRWKNLGWPEGGWHSHHHSSGKYVVGDTKVRFYRGTPSTVRFLNREDRPGYSGLSTTLKRNDYVGANYHIDPHPRFAGGETLL